MRRILLLPAALMAVGLLVVVVPVDAGAQATSATVEATNYEYTPDRVTIAVGGTVTFRAPASTVVQGNDEHPTRCIPENDPSGETRGDCPWGRFDLDPGGPERTITFPESGTFQYICTVHPIMDGVVVVGDGNPPSSEPSPSPSPSSSPSPTPSPSPSPSPSPTPSPTPSPSPSLTAAADPAPEPTSEPKATQTPVSADEDRGDDEVAPVVPDPTNEPADVTFTEPSEPGVAIEAGTELADLAAFAAQVLAVLLLLATMGAHVAVRTILRD